MLALSETEMLNLAGAILGLAAALFVFGAALVSSPRFRRKRLSYVAFRPSFSPRSEEHREQLLFALENTGGQLLDEVDLKDIKLVFPAESNESKIERWWVRHNPNGVDVSEIKQVGNGLQLSLGGMNRKDLLVLELSVSNYQRAPIAEKWIRGGEPKELPVQFSPVARYLGIGFGAAGVLAAVYGAWEHSGWLIVGGAVAFAAGFFVHGWARRLARIRLERIIGEPVS